MRVCVCVRERERREIKEAVLGKTNNNKGDSTERKHLQRGAQP
jgi:hypothetical protein